MSADFRDTAHLVTGTLDTSGFGEGDLRDVALVYKDQPREEEPAPEPQADDLTPPPLFTADGEPTEQALPAPEAPQIGQLARDTETGVLSEWNGTDWIEVPEQADDSQPETAPTDTGPAADACADTPPVDQTAHADKESKTPAGVKARRGKAAG